MYTIHIYIYATGEVPTEETYSDKIAKATTNWPHIQSTKHNKVFKN